MLGFCFDSRICQARRRPEWSGPVWRLARRTLLGAIAFFSYPIMSDSSNILILDDHVAIVEMLRQHIGAHFTGTLPLGARSVAEANVLNFQYEFAAYIVDLVLPDGSGSDFISDVRTVLPDSKFVVITGQRQEEARRQLMNVGDIPILEKPFDILELDALLRGILPRDAAGAETFRGSLRKLRLVDLIQVKCLGHDTCEIVITNPAGASGLIGFCQGAIVHASTGQLQGKPAFNEMLRWKNGSFHETDFNYTVERNIYDPWEMVLMDAVRLSDEFHAVEVA